MTMKKTLDGSTYTDTTTEKRFDGASWIDLTIAKRFDGSAWIDIAFPGGGGGALSATVNDSTVFGSEFRLAPPAQPAVLAVGSDNPSTVTVTPTGGTGPYTILWTHEDGDSAVQVLAPTSFTTGFIANVGKNQSKGCVKKATVTDSLGATAVLFVGVTLQYIYET